MRFQNDRFRQLGLVVRANGVFSAGSGLVLVISSFLLDSWLGVHAGWLIAVGASLIGYGMTLYRSSSNERVVASVARFATAADLAWVGGAAALIALTDVLSRSGEIALVAVTIVVMVFAIGQIVGLRRIGATTVSEPSSALADKG